MFTRLRTNLEFVGGLGILKELGECGELKEVLKLLSYLVKNLFPPKVNYIVRFTLSRIHVTVSNS